MQDLKDIRDGAPFDVVATIRDLAGIVYELKSAPNMADRKTVATPESTVTPALEPTTDAGALASLLNSRLSNILAKAGYTTLESLKDASDEQLLAIDGVSEKTLKLIREKIQ